MGSKGFQEGDTVTATFVSACPRNHLRTGDTFLAVQRFMADGSWETVHPAFSAVQMWCVMKWGSCHMAGHRSDTLAAKAAEAAWRQNLM